MLIEFKDGEVIEAKILAKALNIAVVRTANGKYLLISKYSLKDPKFLNFKEVNEE